MSQTYALHKGDQRRDLVRANVHAFIDRLPPAKSWRIEVKELRKERSLDQNAAMFGVAYAAIMEATGLEGDEERKQLHHDFCGDFFGWVSGPMGHRRPVRTTTRNERGERELIDTATMARFYEFIQRRAAEYGIDVPDPDPLWNEQVAA